MCTYLRHHWFVRSYIQKFYLLSLYFKFPFTFPLHFSLTIAAISGLFLAITTRSLAPDIYCALRVATVHILSTLLNTYSNAKSNYVSQSKSPCIIPLSTIISIVMPISVCIWTVVFLIVIYNSFLNLDVTPNSLNAFIKPSLLMEWKACLKSIHKISSNTLCSYTFPTICLSYMNCRYLQLIYLT